MSEGWGEGANDKARGWRSNGGKGARREDERRVGVEDSGDGGEGGWLGGGG
jgi:hypothetical protein